MRWRKAGSIGQAKDRTGHTASQGYEKTCLASGKVRRAMMDKERVLPIDKERGLRDVKAQRAFRRQKLKI